jgi:prephenate dehydratase
MNKLKIGYLGPEGTFSQEAANLYNKKDKHVPYPTIFDLVAAVEKGEIDEVVVPLENSIEGSVGITLDLLVKTKNVKIKKEIILPVDHNLIGPAKTKLKKVTDVLAHPQAIAQCYAYLRKKIPQAVLHYSGESTADAVRRVAKLSLKKSSHLYVSIGTNLAAKLYGLEVLTKQINDYPDNSTRFVVLAKVDYHATSDDKTSFVFSALRDKPGGLYEILGEFAKRKINLTKIESRPSKRVLGDYYFFIDFQGHRLDAKSAAALVQVRKKASFFKLLGSYPRKK